jgi:hypothetical protein
MEAGRNSEVEVIGETRRGRESSFRGQCWIGEEHLVRNE